MANQLRHLRSGDPNKRPAAAEMAHGQLAVNYANGTPALFFKDSADGVVKVGPVHVGTTAPNAAPAGSAGNSIGEGWLDTSLTPPLLKVWTGTAWVAAVTPAAVPAASETVAGIAQVATQAEVDAGTINNEMVTPLKLRNATLGVLSKHSDVATTAPTSGQTLSWNGTNWAPATPTVYTLPARLGAVCRSITDWNLATENGWYMANDALNAPVASGWYMGEVVSHNAIWVTQTVHNFTADSSADTQSYRREQNNGTWGAWYRVRFSEAELDARYLLASSAPVQATETVRGIAELATQAEVDAGTNATDIVTPAKLRAATLGVLSKHSDVATTAPTSGQTLSWNGTAWAPATPLRISTNANNTTVLGTDGGIYTPPFEETDLGELVVLVTHDLTLYVATNGNDTTGDGTQALPWATPHRAMAFLSKCVLADDITATVVVGSGEYQFTKSLNLNHPQGAQIQINGTGTTGTRPRFDALNGGAAPGNTAATKAFNLAALDGYYNTRFLFKGCVGVTCSAGGGVTLNTLLIKGDGAGTTSTHGVIAGAPARDPLPPAMGAFFNLGATDALGCAVHGFAGDGILAYRGGRVSARAITVTNCNRGAFVNHSGIVEAPGATISNNTANGAYISFGGNLILTGAQINYNSQGLYVIYTGVVAAQNNIIKDNASGGVYVAWGGTVQLQTCTVTKNGGDGVRVQGGGIVRANGTICDENTGAGFSVLEGGIITAENSRSRNNGTQPYYANNSGFIRIQGVVANNGYTGTPSPAVNTVGNGACYISNV